MGQDLRRGVRFGGPLSGWPGIVCRGCLSGVIVSFAILIATSTGVEAFEDEQVFEKTSPTSPELKRGDEDAALRHFTLDLWRTVGKSVSEADYPRLARDQGWEGLTKVRVKIGSDGLLKAVIVTRSSGYAVLDDRAVAKMELIKLPDIPEELRDRAFAVEIPFRFSLRQPPKRFPKEGGADAAAASKEFPQDWRMPGPSLK